MTDNCKCKTCKCGKVEEVVELDNNSPVVKLLALSDSPKINCNLTESHNEIYVESVDVIKDACGTGRIKLLGRTVLMNVCESNNEVHVNFDIEINGKEYADVPFIVKLTEDNKTYITINKEYLKDDK